MWRCPAAHDALRGGTCTAYWRRKMVVAEGMGRTTGPTTRDASSDRRRRQAAGCRSAPDVGHVQFNHTELIQGSQTADGKFCATVTAINSPAAGSKLPASVENLIAAGSITSYDPR